MSAVLEGTDSSYYTFIYFHFLYKVCKYLSRALKMNINYINYNFALYSALVKLIFVTFKTKQVGHYRRLCFANNLYSLIIHFLVIILFFFLVYFDLVSFNCFFLPIN